MASTTTRPPRPVPVSGATEGLVSLKQFRRVSRPRSHMIDRDPEFGTVGIRGSSTYDERVAASEC